MKKVTLLLAGLVISSTASAVQFEQSGMLRMSDTSCDILLNENVSINLSTGVKAGAVCSATGIALAACHTGGRTTAREVEVLVESTEPDAAPGTLVSQDPKVYTSTTGPAVATASTFQGTVISQYPQADSCTAAVAETAATARLNAN